MGTIKILSAALSDQIAAGEVVERPSSVAKELLENALDAKASRITIDFDEGGVKRLRIVDNGCGMTPEDAQLSIRRHATSKIQNVEDLNQIGTLGFRGEALASIASVSRFSLRTKVEGALAATKIEVMGGDVAQPFECGGPIGTEIVVSDLFYNVPARRKFLKKTQTEAAHIVETAQRLAICYPTVAIKVVRDGKTVLDLPAHGQLDERLEALFPSTLVKKLKRIHVPGAFGLTGVIGPPEEARGSTRHYYLFINGRIVKDRVLMSAVQGGCGHRLSKGKHPFAVVSLELPAQAVDVNVHPAKTEVRFADSRQVYRLVARAVEGALSRADHPPSMQMASGGVSGLEIKRVVDASALSAESSPSPEKTGDDTAGAAHTDALAVQKRRVFDAMARLAKKQTSVPETQFQEPKRHGPVTPMNVRRNEVLPQKAWSFEPSKSLSEASRDADSDPSDKARLVQVSPTPIASSREVEMVTVSDSNGDAVTIDAPLSCAVLSDLTPMVNHEGMLVFTVDGGLIVLDVSALQREVFRERIRKGSFSWSHWQMPLTKTLNSADRTQKVVELLSGLGIKSEAFGRSTVRLIAHDECLDAELCGTLVQTMKMDNLLDSRTLERALMDVAQKSRLGAWRTVLADADAAHSLNASLSRLKSTSCL